MNEAKGPEHVVALRPVEPRDLGVFFEHQLDVEAAQMAEFASRDGRAFIAHWGRIAADPEAFVRTITCDGEVVGNVVRWVADGVPCVGYWIGREHWGKGIASRALAEFVDLLHDAVVWARVSPRNRGSIKVLECCGFRMIDDGPEEFVYELRRRR